MRDSPPYIIYIENHNENNHQDPDERMDSKDNKQNHYSSYQDDEESYWYLYQNKKDRFLSHYM